MLRQVRWSALRAPPYWSTPVVPQYDERSEGYLCMDDAASPTCFEALHPARPIVSLSCPTTRPCGRIRVVDREGLRQNYWLCYPRSVRSAGWVDHVRLITIVRPVGLVQSTANSREGAIRTRRTRPPLLPGKQTLRRWLAFVCLSMARCGNIKLTCTVCCSYHWSYCCGCCCCLLPFAAVATALVAVAVVASAAARPSEMR